MTRKGASGASLSWPSCTLRPGLLARTDPDDQQQPRPIPGCLAFKANAGNSSLWLPLPAFPSHPTSTADVQIGRLTLISLHPPYCLFPAPPITNSKPLIPELIVVPYL